MSDPVHLLAAGFGTGLVPRAPGTAGTLAGVLLYLALAALPLPAYLGVSLGLFLLGVWICGRAAHDLNAHDHPSIVFDEMIGYLVTMAGAPFGIGWLALGFVLFRFFDIVKPWPISLLDRKVPGGFGIMLDDLAAGLLALAVLQAVRGLPG
jgi:phosphatidylglycerophosphatase A